MRSLTEPAVVRLFKQMSDLTAPECANICRIPHSCCSPEYCEMTIRLAADNDVVLEPTGHPMLPLMGAEGCVAPPHLRPNCTFHTCAINNFGFKPGDPKWTKRYFALRAKIDAAIYAE